jgi:hypothetical protein
MSSLGIIQEESPQACQMCGVIDECRPYGLNDEEICFDCAMKDPETTERKMAKYLFGENK